MISLNGANPLTFELDPSSASYQGGVLESPNTQTPTNTFKFGMRVLNAGSFNLNSITETVLGVQRGVGRLDWDTFTVGTSSTTQPIVNFRF